jgi:hypothetical protein
MDNEFEGDLKITNPIDGLILQSKWRVKLYHLNLVGQWDDMGTGHVSIKSEVININ